jgi:hypothetical protein
MEANSTLMITINDYDSGRHLNIHLYHIRNVWKPQPSVHSVTWFGAVSHVFTPSTSPTPPRPYSTIVYSTSPLYGKYPIFIHWGRGDWVLMKRYQMTNNEYQNDKKNTKKEVFPCARFPIYSAMTLSFTLFNFSGNIRGVIQDCS